jgi:hypothetical protein
LYIIPGLTNYNIILGKPWIKKQDAYIDAKKETLIIKSTGITINNKIFIRNSTNLRRQFQPTSQKE